MGKAQTGVSNQVSSAENSNEQALVSLASQQNANSQQLFNQTAPGLTAAENFYSSLATGNPASIATASAPAIQQITQATAGAKQQILNNAPAGGEKNLAIENADVAQGAKIGDVTSGAYLNSYNALAQLAGQGINQSISAAGTGISGLSSANTALGQIGQQQIEAEQMQAQQKGASLGALSSLGGSIFEGAGAAGGFGSLFGLGAAAGAGGAAGAGSLLGLAAIA